MIEKTRKVEHNTEVKWRWRFSPWDLALFVLLSLLQFVVVGWVVIQLRHGDRWGSASWLPYLFGIPFLIGLGMYEARWLTLPLMRVPLHLPARSGWRVGVATSFVPGLEPFEMLEETVGALVAMDYPHDVWVLDEGDDAQVKALCRRLGAHHFTRRGRATYLTDGGIYAAKTKHGNYNAWLDAVGFDRYDVIVNVDPDHIPEPYFLDRLLGYLGDEEVGYVQAAQVYYNQSASFIARGAAEETYAYYSSVQMSSCALGYPIVTGCHTVHRAAALREVGGFAPHEADDMLITVKYRAAGWRGVYVPETLARGLTPVDWPSYLKQQRRWARSVLDVKFRELPREMRRLQPSERVVSTFHGLYYLHGLASALSAVVLTYALAAGAGRPALDLSVLGLLLILALPLQLCDFFRQSFFLNRAEEWGFHWRAGVLRFAKWPWVLLALFDALSGRTLVYTTTSKVRASARSWTPAIPHIVVGVMVATAWVVGMRGGHLDSPMLHLIAGFFVFLSFGIAVTCLKTPVDGYSRSLSSTRPRP